MSISNLENKPRTNQVRESNISQASNHGIPEQSPASHKLTRGKRKSSQSKIGPNALPTMQNTLIEVIQEEDQRGPYSARQTELGQDKMPAIEETVISDDEDAP